MKFGIVQGSAVGDPHDATKVTVSVSLDSGGEIRVVRDTSCDLLTGPVDARILDWNADQYTQETIGTTLAEQGWEVVSSTPQAHGSDIGVGVSEVYFVRQL